MLNYYPLDINFGSLTQTVINVGTSSFQRTRKCTRDRRCVGRVWICNECFCNYVFLYNYSFLFLSSSSLKEYFLFQLKVHYLVIDRGSIVNLFCSLWPFSAIFVCPPIHCLIILTKRLFDAENIKNKNVKVAKQVFSLLVGFMIKLC